MNEQVMHHRNGQGIRTLAEQLEHACNQRDELRDALRGALAADTCPCCGRDNSKYYTCTADDCPGRIAIERAGG